MKTLLDGQTADGSGAWQTWSGGTGYLQAFGTFDGASVALELTTDGGEVVYEITSLGAKDMVAVDLPIAQIRATVSGAGASTNVSARIG